MAGVAVDPHQNRDQEMRFDGLRFALRGDGLHVLRHHGIAHERVRQSPEEDSARRGALLEACRRVDGVARDQGRPRRRIADDHLTGVDAGSEPDREAALELEIRIQDGQGFADLRRRANGPERVILVHLGHAEDRHHRVADELLHRSAVRLDDRPHRGEVAVHDRAQRLRVDALAERRRARDVGEQDRGEAADHALGARLRQTGPARAAELHAVRVGEAAHRTRDGHGGSLWMPAGHDAAKVCRPTTWSIRCVAPRSRRVAT